MDWNLKLPSCDFTEVLEQGSTTFPNLETVDNGNYEKRGFSVDLKLGHQYHHVGNNSTNSGNELVDMWRNQSGVSKVTIPSSSGGSFKKARGKLGASQIVSCLVDGCKSDLSSCRDYHRRHKVCELHSKTPQVTIAGHKQRFCQQCSRFHSLEEFDEGKRSCRKRLDGHNRRRRKPQPESFSRSASLLSTYQGTHLLPFSSPNIAYSTSSPNVINPSWARGVTVKPEPESCTIQNQQNMFVIGSPHSASTSSCYEGVKQHFTLMQNNNIQTSLGISVCQPLLRSISSGGTRTKMFCDNLTTPRIHEDHDSDCALSLLSSPLTQTSTAHQIGFRQIMQQHESNPISIGHSLGPLGLNANRFQPIDSVFTDESQAGNDAPHSLPFQWN